MKTEALEGLVLIVTLALDNDIPPDTIALATRHGCAGELALYLAHAGEVSLSKRLYTPL